MDPGLGGADPGDQEDCLRETERPEPGGNCLNPEKRVFYYPRNSCCLALTLSLGGLAGWLGVHAWMGLRKIWPLWAPCVEVFPFWVWARSARKDVCKVREVAIGGG